MQPQIQVVLRVSTAVVFAVLVGVSIADGNAQSAATPNSTNGSLPHLVITEGLLAKLPRRTVTATEENGETATYSGVDLGVLLARNGAPEGIAIHGQAVADYVVVRASDGYRAVFSLCELDRTFSSKVVLLADKRNGASIGSDLGPFHIVIPMRNITPDGSETSRK
jgi:hypothetical protein